MLLILVALLLVLGVTPDFEDGLAKLQALSMDEARGGKMLHFLHTDLWPPSLCRFANYLGKLRKDTAPRVLSGAKANRFHVSLLTVSRFASPVNDVDVEVYAYVAKGSGRKPGWHVIADSSSYSVLLCDRESGKLIIDLSSDGQSPLWLCGDIAVVLRLSSDRTVCARFFFNTGFMRPEKTIVLAIPKDNFDVDREASLRIPDAFNVHIVLNMQTDDEGGAGAAAPYTELAWPVADRREFSCFHVVRPEARRHRSLILAGFDSVDAAISLQVTANDYDKAVQFAPKHFTAKFEDDSPMKASASSRGMDAVDCEGREAPRARISSKDPTASNPRGVLSSAVAWMTRRRSSKQAAKATPQVAHSQRPLSEFAQSQIAELQSAQALSAAHSPGSAPSRSTPSQPIDMDSSLSPDSALTHPLSLPRHPGVVTQFDADPNAFSETTCPRQAALAVQPPSSSSRTAKHLRFSRCDEVQDSKSTSTGGHPGQPLSPSRLAKVLRFTGYDEMQDSKSTLTGGHPGQNNRSEGNGRVGESRDCNVNRNLEKSNAFIIAADESYAALNTNSSMGVGRTESRAAEGSSVVRPLQKPSELGQLSPTPSNPQDPLHADIPDCVEELAFACSRAETSTTTHADSTTLTQARTSTTPPTTPTQRASAPSPAPGKASGPSPKAVGKGSPPLPPGGKAVPSAGKGVPPKGKGALPPKGCGKGKSDSGKGMGQDRTRAAVASPAAVLPLGKKFHWRPLAEQQLENTVWAEINSKSPLKEVDSDSHSKTSLDRSAESFQVLERIFKPSRASAAGSSSSSAVAATGGERQRAPEALKILDDRRAQNIAIIMAGLGFDKDELCDRMRTLKTEGLHVDNIEKIQEICPNDEERQKLKAFHGSVAKLRDVERRVLPLSSLSRMPQRLRTMSFDVQLRQGLEGLVEECQLVTRASDAARNSKQLRTMLKLVLALGNYMNHGAGARSESGEFVTKGFTVESLPRLAEIKSPIHGNITMLHYVVYRFLEAASDEGAIDASAARALELELDGVGPASRSSVETIRAQLEAWTAQLSMLQAELKVKDGYDPEAMAAMQRLSTRAERQLDALTAQLAGTEKRVSELVVFFGEDPKKTTGAMILAALHQLTSHVTNVANDILRHPRKYSVLLSTSDRPIAKAGRCAASTKPAQREVMRSRTSLPNRSGDLQNAEAFAEVAAEAAALGRRRTVAIEEGAAGNLDSP